MKYYTFYFLISLLGCNINFIMAKETTSSYDSFSTDDIKQNNISYQQDKNSFNNSSVFSYIKQKFTFEAGLLPSFADGGNTITGASFVSFADSWSWFSLNAKLGYFYSKYEINFVSECKYYDSETVCPAYYENLPDLQIATEYKKLEVNELYFKINPSKYFEFSLGRQHLNWGQVDGLSVIGLLILPLNDNLITLSPSRNDFLYPQDLATFSVFPSDNNEIKFYYFLDHRLSPLFMNFYGKEIFNENNKIPNSWAVRNTYYGQDTVFAITYFNGVSYLGGVDRNVNVFKNNNGSFNISNNIVESGDNGPPKSVTDATSYAKSKAIALEMSYNINSKYTIQAEFVVDETEHNFFIDTDLYLDNYLGTLNQEQTDYLNFLAEHGSMYYSNTFLSNITLQYKGTKWDFSISALSFYTTASLLRGNIKATNNMLEDSKITTVPLLNAFYSLDANKDMQIGGFVGNQGGLFGVGTLFNHEYNDNMSYGVSLGYYTNFSDLLNIARVYVDIPPGYSPDISADSLMKLSLYAKLKL